MNDWWQSADAELFAQKAARMAAQAQRWSYAETSSDPEGMESRSAGATEDRAARLKVGEHACKAH